MQFHKTALATLVLIGMQLPAQAATLTIVNRTDYDSTTRVNGGPCSTILPIDPATGISAGITQAGTTNVVSEANIKKACIMNKKNCTAEVFMANDCDASKKPVIATVVFDINTGIKQVSNVANSGYKLTGDTFTATIEYDPPRQPRMRQWMQWIFGG